MKKVIIILAIIVLVMGFYKYKQNKKAKSVKQSGSIAPVRTEDVETPIVTDNVLPDAYAPEVEHRDEAETVDAVQLIVDAAIEETAKVAD